MQTSAEIRWFWIDSPPDGLREWFQAADTHGVPAGGGGTRVDIYLADPDQRELGIKLRGGAGGGSGPVEVKGLVAGAFGTLDVGVFEGPLELWTKWASGALSLDGARLIRTSKRRWLRKFAAAPDGAAEIPLDDSEKVVRGVAPDAGCNVELTEVTTDDGVWWTLGFEAFGPLDTLEDSVRAAALTLAERRPPGLGDARRVSYPEWLATAGFR